jgi:hypothetical protein
MPTVTLRRAISADVRWLELWDDDPAAFATIRRSANPDVHCA